MTRHVAGTEPYTWPYDGRLEPGNLALVLAGWDDAWQRRSIAPAAAAERAEALALEVARIGGLVVTIAHGAAAPSPRPVVLPLDAAEATVVEAAGIDGFHGSALDALLRANRRTHLLVAGNGIEGPVHSTLRSANDRGFECLLVADACSSLTDDLADASAKTVTMSGGIFGAVGTCGAVLDALHLPLEPTNALEA